ncbi:MAG: BREX-3 system P-loop-containing protein BrxF [Armatimonadetes bacterium]|nr:BREX-3 system P-loop-containing protein BrxF [Armatimonadota bacterium]
MSRRIVESAKAAEGSYNRLVLLVGPQGSRKTRVLSAVAAENEWPTINLGLELAQFLVGVPPSRRPLAAADAVDGLVATQHASVVAIDNIEVLFDPSLRLQPLDLLKQVSRSVVLVVAWPGSSSGAALTYAEPGSPEYRTFDTTGVSVLPIESVSDL